MANDDITIYAPSHGLYDGDFVTIADINGLTDANGAWRVYDRDDDSFKLKNPDTLVVEQSDLVYTDAGSIVGQIGGSTDLSHLEGQDVVILGDGNVLVGSTVVGGSISFEVGFDKVIIGLPFMYQVEPMRLDMVTSQGSIMGSKKNIPEVVISFLETLNAQYGDGVDTHDIDWRTEEDYDSPPALFTGEKIVYPDTGFSTDDRFIISGSDPLPCTVRSIVFRTEVTGR